MYHIAQHKKLLLVHLFSLVTSARSDWDRARPASENTISSLTVSFCSVTLPFQVVFPVCLPHLPIVAHVSGLWYSLCNKPVRNLEVV